MITAAWVIACASCGDDEALNPETPDMVAAVKDARIRGWQHIPEGMPTNREVKGWICPDCNPDAPPRHRLKDINALERQRRLME